MKKQILFGLFTLLLVSNLQARGTYQEPTDFLKETFNAILPATKVIWLTGELRKTATEILQHKPSQLRVRYWLKGNRSAWVLNEIGKEKNITAGVVINNNQIERVKVLVFRESRGDEIRHDFFTRQFKQATLQTNARLDRNIDGISGATMSVRALTKLARLALYLSSQINQP